MEYNTTAPLIDLAIKFSTEESYDTAYAALAGNAFKFDNHKSIRTLRFFTNEQRGNALLHLAATGLVEGDDFNQATSIE